MSEKNSFNNFLKSMEDFKLALNYIYALEKFKIEINEFKNELRDFNSDCHSKFILERLIQELEDIVSNISMLSNKYNTSYEKVIQTKYQLENTISKDLIKMFGIRYTKASQLCNSYSTKIDENIVKYYDKVNEIKEYINRLI